MNEKILIIDDEEDIRMLIKDLLEDEGYSPFVAQNSEEAYQIIRTENPALIIQDIWLQGSEHDGLEILKNVKKDRDYIPFIMISGHGTIETAVSAIKQGAYDFIEKPFNSDRLLLMVHRALEKASLSKENFLLKQDKADHITDMSTQIPKHIRLALEKASKTNSRVFLTGEAGTGKNLAAQYLHENSPRKNHPFMVLTCAGKSAQDLEVELFGSIDGQSNAKPSLLSLVNNGTLLLDEVMALPEQTQGKVLMLLQENAYCPVGSNQKSYVDIRIISTTSHDFEQLLADGSFRQDLFYRLNVVEINLPALRERKQDIPDLLHDQKHVHFTDKAITALQAYSWPGNIKQLNNMIEYLTIMHNKETSVDVDEVLAIINKNSQKSGENDNEASPPLSAMQNTLEMGLREAREYFERNYLINQINKFDGNISKTAEFIGMERSALHRKLKSLDVFSDDKQNVA